MAAVVPSLGRASDAEEDVGYIRFIITGTGTSRTMNSEVARYGVVLWEANGVGVV